RVLLRSGLIQHRALRQVGGALPQCLTCPYSWLDVAAATAVLAATVLLVGILWDSRCSRGGGNFFDADAARSAGEPQCREQGGGLPGAVIAPQHRDLSGLCLAAKPRRSGTIPPGCRVVLEDHPQPLGRRGWGSLRWPCALIGRDTRTVEGAQHRA